MEIEKAVANRKCGCGKIIKKGTKHLAKYVQSSYGQNRTNFCKECALKTLDDRIKHYYDLRQIVEKFEDEE